MKYDKRPGEEWKAGQNRLKRARYDPQRENARLKKRIRTKKPKEPKIKQEAEAAKRNRFEKVEWILRKRASNALFKIYEHKDPYKLQSIAYHLLMARVSVRINKGEIDPNFVDPNLYHSDSEDIDEDLEDVEDNAGISSDSDDAPAPPLSKIVRRTGMPCSSMLVSETCVL